MTSLPAGILDPAETRAALQALSGRPDDDPDLVAARLRHLRAYPPDFVRGYFGVEPDPWQMRVLEELPKQNRIALVACKGPGKTCVLAWVAWWFLMLHKEAQVAATSCTEDNLRDGLWKEMAKWQARNKYLQQAFTWSAQRLVCNERPEVWYMSARTWARSADAHAQASALAGLHADNMLFLCDEAGSYPPGIIPTAEAALANDSPDNPATCAKLIIAGNPELVGGPLDDAATRLSHLYYTVHITSEPGNPERTPRVSEQWAQEQIDMYGWDSDYVRVNIRGLFPKASLDALLGVSDVMEAVGRPIRTEWIRHAPRVIGVDVARFGDDRTVLIRRQGRLAYPPVTMREATTDEIAARVVGLVREWDRADTSGTPVHIAVDGSGGYGGGVVDQLRLGGWMVHEVNSSAAAPDTGYRNMRAWMWWEMAQWVKAGGALPDDADLRRELPQPRYAMKQGRLQIEDKEAIKKRLGASPDVADALALTFGAQIAEMPAPQTAEAIARHRYVEKAQVSGGDYDPMERW